MKFDEIIKIYNLLEYGINKITVGRLIEYDIDLISVNNHSIEEIEELSASTIKPNTIVKIKEIINLHYKAINENCSIYILTYLNISDAILNKFVNQKNNLFDLLSCSLEELQSNYNLTFSTAQKMDESLDNLYEEASKIKSKKKIIKKIIQSRKTIYDYKYNEYLYKECADKIITCLENNKEPLPLFTLGRRLGIKVGDLNKVIDYLLKKEYIEATSLGLGIHRAKLVNYLDTINDNPKIDILRLRLLECKTLEEIGGKYNLSKERIRQILNKELDKFPPLQEDRHYKIFVNCKVTRDDYYSLFGENLIEFNYLSTKYKFGKKEISEQDLKEEHVSPEVINRFFNPDITHAKYYYEMKGIISKQKGYFSLNKVYRIFKKEYPTIDLSERNFAARLERMDCIVNSGRKGFRFLDLNYLESENFISKISFQNYKNMCISALKIFKDYKSLMNEYSIKNEYELHNILKYLCSKGLCPYKEISFSRMPIIELDGVTKEDVIESSISKFDGETLDKYLDYLLKKFGYRKDTFLNILIVEYSKYISDGKVVIRDGLSEKEITNLKKVLVSDFYLFDEFKELVESVNVQFDKMTLGNVKLVGYKRLSKCFLSVNYDSLQSYFTKILEQKELFKRDDYLKYWTSNTFNGLLLSMKHNLDLFEYQPGEYISFKRLNKVIGITKEDIQDIKKQIISMFNDCKYFTLKYMKNKGYRDIFENYDFKDCFYKSIFAQDDKMQIISINSTLLFSIADYSITISDFIEDILSAVEMIGRYDLDDLLYKEYGIEMELYEIRNAVAQFNGYYCETMEKFYLTYDLYLEEI